MKVHKEHDNTMQTQTSGAIGLQPTGNAQGGHYFFSLATGQRLNFNHWTELPMPQDVINQVHTLARRSNANRNLLFAWRNGTPIEDDHDESDDEDYNPEDNDTHSEDDSDDLSHDDHDDNDDKYIDTIDLCPSQE